MAHRSSLAQRVNGSHDLDVFHIDLLSVSEGRQTEYTGTHALMLAVLEEGIRSYLTGKGRIRDEAEYWIFGSSRRALFSFAVVCEHLGLDSGAARAALQRLRHNSLPLGTGARSRPNVSRSRRA